MLKFKSYLQQRQIAEIYESIELVENRIEFLKKNYPVIDSSHDHLAQHREAGDIIDHFANHADPSRNKQYTQWIIGQYKKQHIRQEDAPRIHNTLSNFERYKGRLQNKDINQYKHLNDVEDAVEPHIGTVASNKEADRITKKEGAETIYKSDKLHVVKLKTKEAACHYGAGTKWCTAAKTSDNMFDHYNKKGPLYVVQHKPSGRKWQFHFETDQFMDEKDEPVHLHNLVKQHPELKNVKDFKSMKGFHAVHFMNDAERTKHLDELSNPEHLDHLYDHDYDTYRKTVDNVIHHGDEKHVTNVLHHLEYSDKTDNSNPWNKWRREDIAERAFSDPHMTKLRGRMLKKYASAEHGPEFHNLKSIIAGKGNKEERMEILKKNPDNYDLASTVAFNKPDPEHLEFMRKSSHPYVRGYSAVSRNKEHLDKLVNDPHPFVREKVAMYGTAEHRFKLFDDPEERVSTKALQIAHKLGEHDYIKKHTRNNIEKARASANNS